MKNLSEKPKSPNKFSRQERNCGNCQHCTLLFKCDHKKSVKYDELVVVGDTCVYHAFKITRT